MFRMNDRALQCFRQSDRWAIGVGPTVVLVDRGTAKNCFTSTLKEDADTFIFDQQGIMAGRSIGGAKSSAITN